MNYVILKKFLYMGDCNTLLANTEYLNNPMNSAVDNIIIDNNEVNVWHKSNRSVGLEYRYQNDSMTMSLARGIKKELSAITGINFSGGINELCLPFCRYSDKGIIKAHRDIDKVGDSPVEYLVVCMLTQSGVDYHYDMNQDGLWINFNPLKVSGDGKEVMEDYPGYGETEYTKRFYPNLNKGDVIIFKNSNSIHGVDPITVKEGKVGRITCGFRSK